MVVVRGKLTIVVDEGEHVYPAGSIVEIDNGTKMQPLNRDSEVLEFFVVKAPGPRATK
jgi:mannose-6-phosphate isomerase-like protein (cupin superfamily)